jgi:hypothetical protein
MTFGIDRIRTAVENYKRAKVPAPFVPAPVTNPVQNEGGSLRAGYLSPHFSLAELTVSPEYHEIGRAHV